MRTIVRIAGVAGVLAAAACGGTGQTADDSFRKDLELASTATPINLQDQEPAAQVVSAIERTTPPAPRTIANSQRAVKRTPAPEATPKPVEVTLASAAETEPQPVEIAPDPREAPLPSSRPRPVASAGTGSDDGAAGIGLGEVIGVVLRGGRVGIDDCPPPGGRGRGATIAINNRVPIVGTFPGRVHELSTGGALGSFPGRAQPTIAGTTGRIRF